MTENDDPEIPLSTDGEPEIPEASAQDDEATILATVVAPQHEVIGDFEILAKLGAGGMGAVYRARQISLGRLVALKILPQHAVDDPDTVARFRREARVAASLTHGNLVKVYSAGEVDGCHYIAMELIEGEDLGLRIRREKKLSIPEALRIIADVARGLNHGWKNAHIVHRDIKPGNIFLSAHGEVKLGDLGLAKSALGSTTSGITQTGTMMGTPYYISPEQARADKELDFRADIYSLGCTLYHMLTGEVPYKGTEAITIIRQHLDAPLPAIMKVMPQCPIVLARLVGKMLKKSRHERHTSYDDLIAQIESVWAQLDPLSFQPEAFAPPTPLDPEATIPQADTVDAAATTPRVATARATAVIPAKPKSKLLLYGGIAAGAIALGVIAALAWPKKEAPPPKSPTATTASTTFPKDTVTAIKLWDSPEKLPPNPKIKWQNNAISLDGDSLQKSDILSRNAILRASIRMNPDAKWPQISLRTIRRTGGDNYKLIIRATGGTVDLSKVAAGKQSALQEWRLPRTYTADEWARVELKTVDSEITVTVDGVTLGSVHDESVNEAGGVMLYSGGNGYFRDIEYVPLDPPASLANSTSPLPQWQDLLSDPARLKLTTAGERTPAGLLFNQRCDGMVTNGPSPINGAIRVRTIFGKNRPILSLRSSSAGGYQLGINSNGKSLKLMHWNGTATTLNEFDLKQPLRDGIEFTAGIAVLGRTLVAMADGQIVGKVTDESFARGGYGFTCGASESDPVIFTSLETLNLDGISEADALRLITAPEARAVDLTRVDFPSLKLDAKTAELKDGTLLLKSFAHWRLPDFEARNMIARATIRWEKGRTDFKLRVRTHIGDQNKTESIFGHLRQDPPMIGYAKQDSQGESVLQTLPLPAPLEDGRDVTFEIAVIGSRAYLRIDGQAVGSADNLPIAAPGAASIQAINVLVKKLEVIDLDNLSEDDARKFVEKSSSTNLSSSTRTTGTPSSANIATAAKYPPGKWTKVIFADSELPRDAVRTTDGILTSSQVAVPGALMCNGAIRAEVKYDEPFAGQLQLRAATGGGSRQMNIYPNDLSLLAREKDQPFETLGKSSAPLAAVKTGDWTTVQFSCLSATSIGTVNGMTIQGESQSVLQPGAAKIGHAFGASMLTFRNLEVLNLDGLPEAEALKLLNSLPASTSAGSTPPLASVSALWQKLVPNDSILRATNGSMNAAGDWHVEGGAQLTKSSATNVALRCEIRLQASARDTYFHLRSDNGVRRSFNIHGNNARLHLGRDGPGGWPTLGSLKFPESFPPAGEWIPVQFAVVGRTSIAQLGSLPVIAGNSTEALSPGAITVGSDKGVGADFRNLEFLPLDDLPESQWPEFIRTGLGQVKPDQQ